MHPLSHPTPVRRVICAVAGLLALVASASPGLAQFEDCGDTISLYSPAGFRALYEVAPNPQRVNGVRLSWEETPDSLAGCVRLEADPALESALGLEIRGRYRNRFDRNIQFEFPGAGQIGDPVQSRFVLSVSNTHPNPAAGNLSAQLNLSSLGGVYRFTPQTMNNQAAQVNSGIPPHLGDVVINAFAAAKDRSVLYAAVVGVPVVRSYDGGLTWEEPVERVFPPFSQRMTALTVFPSDPNRVWAAANGRGIWESLDAGVSWQQVFPAGIGPTSTVTVMKFLTVTGPSGAPVDRLYLGARSQALAYSDDEGATFVSVGDFDTPTRKASAPNGAVCEQTVLAKLDVNTVEVSPNDPSVIYVGVGRWGVYAGDSRDHSTWQPRFDGLVICDSSNDQDRPQGEQRSVIKLAVLNNAGSDLLVAATERQVSPNGEPDLRSQTILFVSQNGGVSWQTKGDGYPLNPDGDAYAATSLIRDPRAGKPLGVIVATFGAGLWELNLAGGPGQGNWSPVSFAPGAGIKNPRCSSLYVTGTGDILVGTSDSGIYQPGVWIDLTRALNRTAQSFDSVVSLGLQVRFTNPGSLVGGESFSAKAQNFQGYAVWRAVDIDRDENIPAWELIGLLDLANPEACAQVTCDELSQPQEVNCFANKRANCFVPQVNEEEVVESWEFFDRDVFNGYTYWYAVSTFDFGYTGETSVESFDGGMVFSPRWPVERDPAAAIFNNLAGGENYNGELFQVNVAAVPELRDNEVFVVPNPLVRSAGWDLGDAASVRIVNVTATSTASIYTLAGDLVRQIDNVDFAGVERGNIEWDTRNADGEPVASGVYIYRVTDEQGGEIVGRFTIIR